MEDKIQAAKVHLATLKAEYADLEKEAKQLRERLEVNVARQIELNGATYGTNYSCEIPKAERALEKEIREEADRAAARIAWVTEPTSAFRTGH